MLTSRILGDGLASHRLNRPVEHKALYHDRPSRQSDHVKATSPQFKSEHRALPESQLSASPGGVTPLGPQSQASSAIKLRFKIPSIRTEQVSKPKFEPPVRDGLWKANRPPAAIWAQNVSDRIREIDVRALKVQWAEERIRLGQRYDLTGSDQDLENLLKHTSDKRLHSLEKDRDFLTSALRYCQVLTLPQTWAELRATAIPKCSSSSDGKEDDVWKEKVAAWDKQASAMPLYKPNVIVETSDHHIVLYKIRAGIDAEPSEQEQPLSKSVEASVEELRRGWANEHVTKAGNHVWSALPSPGPGDHRHHAFAEMRAKYGTHHAGVWHLAYWHAQGNTHLGPVVSSQQCSGSHKHRYTSQFLKNISPLQTRIANFFRILEPEAYERYKRNYDELASRNADLEQMQKNTDAVFLGLAVVYNLRVLPHRDSSDDPEGFVAMTNIGRYTGGQLIVGTEDTAFKLDYKPGDFVLFNSTLLKHAVTPFESTRAALVFFSHRSVFACNEAQSQAQFDIPGYRSRSIVQKDEARVRDIKHTTLLHDTSMRNRATRN